MAVKSKRDSAGGRFGKKPWFLQSVQPAQSLWTCTEERMLRMELPGKRKRGRPKRGFVYAVREAMAVVEVTGEDADKTKWRWKSPVATP